MARKGKIKCSCCGEEKSAARDFYSSSSELYNVIGVFPICKDCVKDRYSKLLSLYNMDIKKAFQKLLMTMDLYFNAELLDNCIEKSKHNGKDWFGEYIRQITSNSKYKIKSTLDNIEVLEDINKVETEAETKEDIKDKIPKKLIRRWGKGLEYDDYEYLEEKYDEYSKFYNDKTPAQKTLLQQISKCLWKLNFVYIEDDDSVKKYTDTLSKLMADTNIKPSSKSKIDDDDNLIFGKIMQIYEKTKPVIDRDKQYKDVDGIFKYIYKFFIKPTAMALGLAKGNYDVDDGDKNIELNDEFNEIIKGSKDE